MLQNMILALAVSCAPNIAPETIYHIVSIEASHNPHGKGFNPYSINIEGVDKIVNPQNLEQAIVLTEYYLKRGRNVDMGLMQISSQHLKRINMTPRQIFQPCTNIRVGAYLLKEIYERTSKKEKENVRLLKSISAYNTGNFTRGFQNGHVHRFVASVRKSNLIIPKR